ncbi:unnamed protein product [Rotaria sordida]|uniref:Uncharacterized protein n=1 Tax=Rotaria sordida TaxID=392033 RepID=A0A816C2R1_9BILA|nr:unnamed protein product [Rotaria sordida]CAF1616384.1 unnamed protein product [Rotaria sordida]
MDQENVNGSIHPYRNIWIDIYKHPEIVTYFNQNTENSSIRLIPTIQLSINGNSSDEKNHLFIDKFKSIFSTTYFTRLNINCKNISIEQFVKIIHLLSNLDSLKISYVPIIQLDWLFDNDRETCFTTSIKNKITKVNLIKMIDIEQMHLLLYLYRPIQYFQIDLPKNMNLQMIVRFIIIKSSIYTPYFNCLCLSIPNFNEDSIEQLEKLIESEKLLFNYRIKCICGNVLLKWNRF